MKRDSVFSRSKRKVTNHYLDKRTSKSELLRMENRPLADSDVEIANSSDLVQQDDVKSSNKCVKWLKQNAILIAMILAMVVGIGLGIGLRSKSTPWTDREVMYLAFPGEVMMRMLKMLILPLIITSLLSGLAALDSSASGRMGGVAVCYYILTTIVAVILGIILVLTIRPGVDSTMKSTQISRVVNPVDSILDLVRNMFPDNVVTACFKQTKTILEKIEKKVEPANSTTTVATTTASLSTISTAAAAFTPETDEGYKPVTTLTDGTNIMGLIVFVIALGIVISRMGERGRPLVLFFQAMNDAVMKLVSLVIWYTPIGVVFLVAAKIVNMVDPAVVLTQLGMYMVTVLAGLAIHAFIILPLIYGVIVRKNPFKYMLGVVQALITAIATASSSATLPVTFKCLEENLNVDKRVTRFVLPVGATINMDGTALYEAVAVIFIAQVNNMTLSIGQVIVVSVTATAAAIGAASIPQAGLVTMLIILTAVGLPSNDITLIIAVDWFLDRFRTSVNVLGDSIGCAVVEKFCAKSLHKESDDVDNPSDSLELSEKPDISHDDVATNGLNDKL